MKNLRYLIAVSGLIAFDVKTIESFASSNSAKKYTCSYEYMAKGAQVIVTRENIGVNKDGTLVACTDALTACQNAVKNQNPPVKCKFFSKGEVKK